MSLQARLVVDPWNPVIWGVEKERPQSECSVSICHKTTGKSLYKPLISPSPSSLFCFSFCFFSSFSFHLLLSTCFTSPSGTPWYGRTKLWWLMATYSACWERKGNWWGRKTIDNFQILECSYFNSVNISFITDVSGQILYLTLLSQTSRDS